ncbi:MAG: hypothetical protein BMS9Abin26_1222 [Gammaproteobacteria bacterium]|nr:MAG: hypothetical protein BMS9Abin26_1222 [Gammaproteobacteria bacterium]
MSYSNQQRELLLQIAGDSIEYGLRYSCALSVEPSDYENDLQAMRATFVTLHLRGELRGCIGNLEARQPLVVDVARNAYNAAFSDPRFSAMTSTEALLLDIHISVLGPHEPIDFSDEKDLLAQIRPDVDGLILSDGACRGTFLPSVWEQLPAPRDFLEHLKMKAGLPGGYWSETIRVERYTTESFGAE